MAEAIYSDKCKLCNHPRRAEIEKLIRSRESYASISRRFPGLYAQNLRDHWKLHMLPARKAEVNRQIEEDAVIIKDSILELNKLMDVQETLMLKQIERLESNYQAEDFVRQANAIRGMINARKGLIALNVALVGDTKQTRDLVSLKKLLKVAKKGVDDLKKKEANTEDVVIAEVQQKYK